MPAVRAPYRSAERRTLRVGHQAENVAAFVDDPSDPSERSVRRILAAGAPCLRVGVTEEDAPAALQHVEIVRRQKEKSLVVGDGEVDDLSFGERVREGCVVSFDANMARATDEAKVFVRQQGTRQKLRFGEDLEAVAYADEQSPLFDGRIVRRLSAEALKGSVEDEDLFLDYAGRDDCRGCLSRLP